MLGLCIWFMNITIKNACIITCDEDVIIPDGYLKIKDNLIESVGKMSALKDGADKAFDAGGRVVMPGFINPHMHLYSQFARGIKVPKMVSFLEILESFWWKLDKTLKEEDVYLSGLIGLIEAIKSGVTTVIDHHASYGSIKGSLMGLSEAFSQTNMRGALCYEVSDRNGEKDCGKAIDENVSFLEEVAEKCVSHNYLLRGMFGLHASFTLSPATLKKVIHANEKFGAPYHIHVAEGFEDAEDSKSRFNSSVVRRLHDEGILTEGSIAAHCVHVNDTDIDILKKSGVFVIHNPVSNMNNAVGRAPYLKMMAAGIPVGIGTDGMSAGIAQDCWVANVAHKEAASNPQAGWNEVKKSTLIVNPAIATHLFGHQIGKIKPGAVADIIVAEYTPYTSIDSSNYWGHVLFGVANSKIHSTVVNGKVLMENHRLIGIDEVRIINEARKLSAAMWKRFNG